MLIRARVAGFIVLAMVLAGACGGGSGESNTSDVSDTVDGSQPISDNGSDLTETTALSTSDGALVVDGEVNLDALDALVTEFVALDADQQAERVNELSGELERRLYEVSGLEEGLGGPEAVEVSIAETAQWFADLAEQVTSSAESVELEPQGFRGAGVEQAGTPSIGEGLFGGIIVTMLGGEAAVSSTNDGRTGEGELAKGVNIKATNTEVELTTDNTSTDSKGVTTTLATRNVITPCPGPDGTFEASASIDTSSTINNGATGKRGTLDVTIKGTVDDNAALVGYDTTARSQYADFTAGKGGFFDLTVIVSQTGNASATFNRTGGTVTQEIFDTAVALNRLMMSLAADRLAKAAQLGWESGRCVELKSTVSAGPKGLKPSASVTITAAPRSKVDGGPTGGTVTALLTGGEASVTPSSTPVPADAEFTYEAPGEKDKTGTVSLEARSKRGVAKATIDFDTKSAPAYTITGGDPPVDAVVCDIEQPFQITVDYGVARFDFDYSGGLVGTATFTGSGMITGSGTATYTVDFPNGADQPGTLTATAAGDFEMSGVGSEAGSSGTQYVVTPTEPCTGD